MNNALDNELIQNKPSENFGLTLRPIKKRCSKMKLRGHWSNVKPNPPIYFAKLFIKHRGKIIV